MRRLIYSAENSDINGEVYADAGTDQQESYIADLANLDGTGSTSDLGTVDTYLWEIVSGNGLIIDDPTSSTSSISGTPIVGITTIRLTVSDSLGNTDSDTVTIEIEAVPEMTIIASASAGGTGYIEIDNGQPNEVVNLNFIMYNGNPPDQMSFSGGIMVGVLDSFNPNTTGSITLDGTGNGTSNYTGVGSDYQVDVVMTSRDSAIPIPTNNSATIYIP